VWELVRKKEKERVGAKLGSWDWVRRREKESDHS
jgi:hypothetical protein